MGYCFFQCCCHSCWFSCVLLVLWVSGFFVLLQNYHLKLHVRCGCLRARTLLGPPQCCQDSCCNSRRNKFSTECPLQLTTKSKRLSVIHLFNRVKNRKVHTSKKKILRGPDTFTSLSYNAQTEILKITLTVIY